MLKVDAAAGKLSLSLKLSSIGDAEDDGSGDESATEASEDLDEAMAERLQAVTGANSFENVLFPAPIFVPFAIRNSSHLCVKFFPT